MCVILIDRIEGTDFQESTGQYDSINVIGQVTGCPAETDSPNDEYTKVIVQVTTEDGTERNETATVLTNGNLTATFEWTAFFKGVPCQGRANVKARCAGSPENCFAEANLEMQCDVSLCPAVTFSSPTDDGCDNSGNRLVSITATVQGPPLNQFAFWEFGDGNLANSEFNNSTSTTVQLEYEPADMVHVNVSFGLNPDCEYTLQVPEDIRQPCPASCPQVTFSNLIDQGCDSEGNRLVSITATVQGDPLFQNVYWEFGNENVVPGEFEDSNITTVQLPYSPDDLGSDQVIFSLNPACQYTLQVPANLRQSCPVCPPVAFSEPLDGGCDGDNRLISITAEVEGPPLNQEVKWFFGNGKEAAIQITNSNSASIDLPYGPDDLEHSDVTFKLSSPECDYSLQVAEAIRQPCPPPTPPPEIDNGGGGQTVNLCLLWLIANLLMMVVTGVAIVIAGCAPNPYSIGVAIVLAIVTVISWFLFWLICLRSTGDCNLARWAAFLLDLLATAMGVIAAIWGIVTAIVEVSLGCFIGALITFAYYGLIALWFTNLVILMGCYRNSSYLPWED